MAHLVVLGAGPGAMPTAHGLKARLRAGDRASGGQSALSAHGVAKLEAK